MDAALPTAARRPTAVFRSPLLGPLLTVLAIAIVEALARAVLRVPSLTVLLAVVAFVSFLYGLRAGLLSAALVSLYGVYYFSLPGRLWHYSDTGIVRLVLLPLTAAAVALAVGVLRGAVQAREAELRKQLEFSRAIDQSLAEGVYAIDPEGRATFVNPAAEGLLGWTRAELLGRVMHEAIHYQRPDGTPYPREECSGLQVVRDGIPYRTEDDFFIRKDGTLFPVAYSSAPLVEGGQVAGAVVAFRDTSERKRAEEALRASEERFRALVQNASDVILVVDAGGAVLYVSPSIERVMGYRPAAVVGGKVFDTMPVHPDDLGRMRARFADFLANPGEEIPVELRLRHADGSWRTIEAIARNLLHDPSVGGIVSNYRDITARRRAEDALRESEAKLRLITAQMPAHLWTTDTELRVTSVLGAGLERVGIDSRQYLGKTLDELGRLEPQIVDAHRRALAGEPAGYEIGVRDRQYDVRVEPLRDAQGRVIGCLALALDITERKWGERRLAAQHEVSRALAEAADLREAAPRILQAIGDCLEWDYGALWIVDRRDHVLRCVDTWHSPLAEFAEFAANSRQTAFAPGVGLPGRVWAGGEPLWIADTAADANFPRLRVAAAAGLRAGFGLPIRLDGQVIGVFEFLGRQVREPDRDALEMLAALGGQIGQFIERKRAEGAVRESEARKGAILESALDAIITMDGEGKIVEFNPAAERMFGYAAAAAVGREMAELIIPPALRERHRRGLARYLATGEGAILDRRVELAALRADGTEFPVELAITRIPLEEPPLFTGYIHDITERKRAQAALEERARQQAAVAGFGQRALATPDLDVVLDEAARLVTETLEVEYCKVLELLPGGDALLLRAGAGWKDGYVGQATISAGPETQGGYSLTRREPVIIEDIAADPRFIVPPLLRDHGVVSSMSVVIPARERPFGVLQADTARRRRFTPDDSNFLQAVANVLGSALARKAFERRLAEEEATSAAAREISERLILTSLREREAAEAQRAEAARLAELDRLRREFISSVSHELRTPLTSARLGIGMLQTRVDGRLGPDEREVVTVVRRNIERLTLHVDDLLAINQADAGVLQLKREPLDLRAVVADAAAAVQPLLADKGQALEVELATPLPVDGDARRLEQVFVNLLGNAHEHTPAGTRIAVSGWDTGAEVRLTVRDDGPGIPEGQLEGIFERFRRLDKEGGGSGLGLAVTKAIVELHGGRVWAESPPGAGAAFHIALPRAAPAGADTA